MNTNTKIAKALNETINSVDSQSAEKAINGIAEEIVNTHNAAVKYGLIQLPFLNFIEATTDKDFRDGKKIIDIEVNFKSGMAEINDIFNIKTVWGANEVYFLNSGRTTFEFKI